MRALATLLFLILPMQAAALSCLRPTVERSFAEVSAAPETYVVVAGRLTLDARKLPKSHAQGTPAMTRLAGTLTGKSLTKIGFNVPFEKNVTLEVACFGPWCGSVQNGAEVLAFVRRENGRYLVEVSPCGGRVFGNPKRAMLNKVSQCFKRGGCP